MANHFHRIGRHLEKIQKMIYQSKPDENLSLRCVQDLDLFEAKFLNPVEKLLLPYHDKRWVYNWTDQFKIQMDSLIMAHELRE